jgi:hypothetical protein
VSGRQRFITAVLIAGVITLGAGLATLVPRPQQAFGCEGPPAGGTGQTNCGPPPPPEPSPPPCKTWKTPPRLVVHYSELSSGQSPMTWTVSMIGAPVELGVKFIAAA